ncbi:MAG: hypothetical protein ABR585_15975, partial [Gemmatimonadaceae bacterium]
ALDGGRRRSRPPRPQHRRRGKQLEPIILRMLQQFGRVAEVVEQSASRITRKRLLGTAAGAAAGTLAAYREAIA